MCSVYKSPKEDFFCPMFWQVKSSVDFILPFVLYNQPLSMPSEKMLCNNKL